jgi:RNA polymerase sigma-70 factor (ECF subfamily)
MPDDVTDPLLRLVRRTAAGDDAREWTDCELLRRYVSHRDDAAFEVLVRRHGAMVWRVCRNRMPEAHAAEDAFQATFLILIRKAASLGQPDKLANWLYGVADRVARRSRQTLTREQERQRPGLETVAAGSVDHEAASDLEVLLHEELRRLPAKYRSPLILCYLEDRTTEEAAKQLRWPVGTLKVRLMRGRRMLRTRLERRGWPLSAGALATALSADAAPAVPAGLVGTTVRAATVFAAGRATGAVSANVLTLTEGVLKTMFVTRLTIGGAALITAGLLTAGAGFLAFHTPAEGQTVPPAVAVLAAAALVTAADNAADREAARKAEVAKLQGTWKIVTMEIDGNKTPDNAVPETRMILKNDTFGMVSLGATLYRGNYKIDVSRTPKTLDIEFTEGPEKGNTALAIYELDGDNWKICLTVGAKERPKDFATKASSGLALETLRREPAEDPAEMLKKELALLDGEWTMVSVTADGQAMPEAIAKTGKRVAHGNETTVTIAGQLVMKATFTIDPTKKPKTIDYTMTDGPTKGQKQYGIYEIDGDTVLVCFAPPGKDRPTEFVSKPGDGRALTVWKMAKP